MGRDGVDKWTDQKLWDAVLTNVRVVVGTPQVLVDALTHGFVRISRLALLVFDEGMWELHLLGSMLTSSTSSSLPQELAHERHHATLLPPQQVSSGGNTTHPGSDGKSSDEC